MKSDKTDRLAPQQEEDVLKFQRLFTEVEKALKKRLRRPANDRTGITSLIKEYVGKNPFWADTANELRNLADIRNLLTHQCSTMSGCPIAVAPLSLRALHNIWRHLDRPEPVSKRYLRDVKTVSSRDSLAKVLTLAFENGFSQFPVVTDGRFNGLITESEIVRWLGRRVRVGSTDVDLANISVGQALIEKDPFFQEIEIFHLARLDASVEEVMGRFSAEPALETILLTSSGTSRNPIEGIITQWDAARYAGRTS